MWKWGSITFGIGVALCIFEAWHATRKKEGFTPTDRQRVFGLFWLTCFVTALVVGLIWLS